MEFGYPALFRSESDVDVISCLGDDDCFHVVYGVVVGNEMAGDWFVYGVVVGNEMAGDWFNVILLFNIHQMSA